MASKVRKNDLESHVQELDGQLGELSAKLEELNATLADTEVRMKETKKLLKQAKQEESQQYEAMKKRIRYMYENGNYAYAEMIFSSGSIAELLNNAEYVTKISEYDRDMLEKYQGTKDSIAQKNKELKQQYQESQNLQAQVSQQEAEVSGVIQAKKEQIDQYNDQISDQESLAASYASEMEAQNSILAEIQAQEAAMAAAEEAARQEAAAAEAAAAAAQAEAERKAQEAAEAQAAAQASQDAQAQADAQQKQAEAEAAKQEADRQQQQADNSANTSNGASGGFVWPCPSSYTITSEFGGRESPTAGASSNHMGIDIGAPLRFFYRGSGIWNCGHCPVQHISRKLCDHQSWEWNQHSVYARFCSLCVRRTDGKRGREHSSCRVYRILHRTTSAFWRDCERGLCKSSQLCGLVHCLRNIPLAKGFGNIVWTQSLC